MMMEKPIIKAESLNKSYGAFKALDNVSFTVGAGKIVGLIGPNGAGKTTLLKSILGLTAVEGSLEVLGLNPKVQRTALIEQVSFIADTAILPRWLKVSQAVEYVDGVHPRFNREKAQQFLNKTTIKPNSKIGQLSKGMITQLHLALVMAIDSQILVLDEPTLGLDIIYRKQFYSSLLADYFDGQKTIVITTHQVEEVENILTDLIFIDRGQLVLNTPIDTVGEQFCELAVTTAAKEAVRAAGFKPLYEQMRLGGASLIFEGVSAAQLAVYGEVSVPSIADLFVAKMSSGLDGVGAGGLGRGAVS
ncbi:ATP-binding cassette domain-containing protein [Marinagarivorans algicola]|uniref:ATP-binding cassette domain-containing protein n=1 Tax=Marinagarivorans algicola TaxID=1513270 RepID=UPI0009EC2BAC